MKIHHDQLPIRVMGTLTGIGFLGIGAYAALAGDGLDPYTENRAYGFALAAIVGGLWAISVSWLARDLSGIWCRSPKVWRPRSRRRGPR